MKFTRKKKISEQVREHALCSSADTPPQAAGGCHYDGDVDLVVPTGSTLLDLAISGGRVEGGGIPRGILVEIFGPSGCGKTTLLCEIARNAQLLGGKVMFHDPEARLNRQFARMLGLNLDEVGYAIPNTVSELFKTVRQWDVDPDQLHVVIADSLAALSTEMEMEDKDKMGMRRAREFSEELRVTCRILTSKKILMVCSNQVRVNVEGGPFGQKYIAPGGEAIGFYSSLRLRAQKPQRIVKRVTVNGKQIQQVIGVRTEFEVYKSTVWKPFLKAPVTIIFDYGIDDIRENLEFLKTHTGSKEYKIGDLVLGKTIKSAIEAVERDNLEAKLKQEVIDVWMEIQKKFESRRKPKVVIVDRSEEV